MRSAPAALVLVHGAGNGPWVFRRWEGAFPGVIVSAIDLQQGLNIAKASMEDYSNVVVDGARRLPGPIALCGWSMGGLVALLAAQRFKTHSVVLIEASAPGEVQGFNPHVELVQGTFDPETVYGRFPPGMPSRPESVLARAERKRGISIPSLSCRSLVVYGDSFWKERGASIAMFYGSETLYCPGLHHWDLVIDPRVRDGIARFLGVKAPGAPS